MNKKGFTLVEIVIALAVLSVISAVVSSLAVFGGKNDEQERNKFFAVNICKNLQTVFRAASDNYKGENTLTAFYADYKNRVFDSLDYELPDLVDNTATLLIDNNGKISDSGLTKCELRFTTEQNKIKLTVTASVDDKILCSLAYQTIIKEKEQ